MISKFSVGILVAVATLFLAIPSNVFAATALTPSQVKKYNKTLKSLKKIPNYAGPASKVTNYMKILARLKPGKVVPNYKIALTKLPYVSAGSSQATATKIAAFLIKTVKASGLSTSQIKKLSSQVSQADVNYPGAPSPTPTSVYQAMLLHAGSMVAA